MFWQGILRLSVFSHTVAVMKPFVVGDLLLLQSTVGPVGFPRRKFKALWVSI